jgi:aryl-alcohol dehydrogenase-like predicted oxidoreductase
MNLKQLGNSDLQITPVGLGTWAIGGEGAMGWGPQDDAESIATIRHAVESGINWIDTAAIYGFGHSEKIVSQALRDIGVIIDHTCLQSAVLCGMRIITSATI